MPSSSRLRIACARSPMAYKLRCDDRMRFSNMISTGILRGLLGSCACAAFSTGCNDDEQPSDGGAVPPTTDASTNDHANRDAAPSDVMADDAHPDSDAGCSCTLQGAGQKGVQPLACFCSRTDMCPSYDSARSICRSGVETRLDIYTGCGLEVIRLPEVLSEGKTFVYDSATHTLVGASFATDTLSLWCGTERVNGYQAGTFPPSNCAISDSLALCPADAGGDADVGDAGCACETGDRSGTGIISLDCYCAGGVGECPTYDVAHASCPPGARPEFNRLEEYAGCNYAVITSGGGLGGSKHAYDLATRALVGASRFTDTNTLPCGPTRVFGYQAGAFPDASCAVTRTVYRCGVDGGDASADNDDS